MKTSISYDIFAGSSQVLHIWNNLNSSSQDYNSLKLLKFKMRPRSIDGEIVKK